MTSNIVRGIYDRRSGLLWTVRQGDNRLYTHSQVMDENEFRHDLTFFIENGLPVSLAGNTVYIGNFAHIGHKEK